MTGIHDVYYNNSKCGVLEVTFDGLRTMFVCDSSIVSDILLRLFCLSGGKAVPIGVMVPEKDRLCLRRTFTKSALAAAELYTLEKCVLGQSAADVFAQLEIPDFHEQSRKKALMHDAPSEHVQDVNRSLPYAFPIQATNDRFPVRESDVAGSSGNSIIPKPAPHDPPFKYAPNTAGLETRSAVKPIPSGQLFGASKSRNDPHPFLPSIKNNMPAEEWRPEPAAHELFRDTDIADVCRGLKGALRKEQGGKTLLAVPCRGDEPFPMMPVFCFGSCEMIEGEQYVVFGITDGKLVT